MLVSWSLLDDLTDAQKVLSECLPHIWELVSLELVQAWDNLSNQDLRIQDNPKIGEPSHSSCSHLRFRVLEELAVVGGKMLLRVLKADAVGQLHDLVSHEVPYPPTLVHRELLDVWDQVLLNLVVWQGLREINAAVDTLHSHRVLVVLVKISENLEQVSLWH